MQPAQTRHKIKGLLRQPKSTFWHLIIYLDNTPERYVMRRSFGVSTEDCIGAYFARRKTNQENIALSKHIFVIWSHHNKITIYTHYTFNEISHFIFKCIMYLWTSVFDMKLKYMMIKLTNDLRTDLTIF